jgi:diadenosine tetraphosphate (Ap4A) HIT family hydrolase
MYDKNNVFARIIRGEIPVNKIVENEFAMSFPDAAPNTSKHVLVIPKGEYENILDFVNNASAAEQAGFWKCFSDTAAALDISGDFNIWGNSGADAPCFAQSVFHFHLHLLAGDRLPYFYEAIKDMHDRC